MPLSQAEPVAPPPAGGASGCAGCQKLQRELLRSQRALRESQEREADLQAQLATLRGLLFGRKSETPPPGDVPPAATPPAEGPAGADPAADNPPDNPAEGAEAPGGSGEPERPRKKRGRQPGSPPPPRVPREELPETIERRDVPAADRCCPSCGTAYVPNGYKASWLYEIDWNVIMRKILRLRYKPACGCAAARPVIAKPAPRLGSSQLGPSVWAWCLVQVYWLFRPQAAVARDLEALGLRIPASTLSQGLRRLSHLFEPLEAAIRQRQREAAVAQADETSWPVQFIHGADASCDPPERGRQKPKSWLWVCLAADTALMRILPSRSASSAAQLLEHLGRKAVVYLMCDRYSAYKAFIRQHPELQGRARVLLGPYAARLGAGGRGACGVEGLVGGVGRAPRQGVSSEPAAAGSLAGGGWSWRRRARSSGLVSSSWKRRWRSCSGGRWRRGRRCRRPGSG